MYVDKVRFENLGLKCDKYSEYLNSLVPEKEEEFHHIYPKSVFGEGEIMGMSHREHTRAHLLLAEDNWLLDSREASSLCLGLPSRIQFYCDNTNYWFEEDISKLKNLLGTDSYDEIKSYLLSGLQSKVRSSIKDVEGYIERLRKVHSDITRKQWKDPEVKAKMSTSISESKRMKWNTDPEWRERIREGNRQRSLNLWNSEEGRSKMSEAFHKKWSDPNRRKAKSEEMKELSKLPKVRKAQLMRWCVRYLLTVINSDSLTFENSEGANWRYPRILFNQFGYLLKALGMTDGTIEYYKGLYKPVEIDLPEDLEVWGRCLNDNNWRIMQAYVKTLNID